MAADFRPGTVAWWEIFLIYLWNVFIWLWITASHLWRWFWKFYDFATCMPKKTSDDDGTACSKPDCDHRCPKTVPVVIHIDGGTGCACCRGGQGGQGTLAQIMPDVSVYKAVDEESQRSAPLVRPKWKLPRPYKVPGEQSRLREMLSTTWENSDQQPDKWVMRTKNKNMKQSRGAASRRSRMRTATRADKPDYYRYPATGYLPSWTTESSDGNIPRPDFVRCPDSGACRSKSNRAVSWTEMNESGRPIFRRSSMKKPEKYHSVDDNGRPLQSKGSTLKKRVSWEDDPTASAYAGRGMTLRDWSARNPVRDSLILAERDPTLLPRQLREDEAEQTRPLDEINDDDGQSCQSCECQRCVPVVAGLDGMSEDDIGCSDAKDVTLTGMEHGRIEKAECKSPYFTKMARFDTHSDTENKSESQWSDNSESPFCDTSLANKDDFDPQRLEVSKKATPFDACTDVFHDSKSQDQEDKDAANTRVCLDNTKKLELPWLAETAPQLLGNPNTTPVGTRLGGTCKANLKWQNPLYSESLDAPPDGMRINHLPRLERSDFMCCETNSDDACETDVEQFDDREASENEIYRHERELAIAEPKAPRKNPFFVDPDDFGEFDEEESAYMNSTRGKFFRHEDLSGADLLGDRDGKHSNVRPDVTYESDDGFFFGTTSTLFRTPRYQDSRSNGRLREDSYTMQPDMSSQGMYKQDEASSFSTGPSFFRSPPYDGRGSDSLSPEDLDTMHSDTSTQDTYESEGNAPSSDGYEDETNDFDSQMDGSDGMSSDYYGETDDTM